MRKSIQRNAIRTHFLFVFSYAIFSTAKMLAFEEAVLKMLQKSFNFNFYNIFINVWLVSEVKSLIHVRLFATPWTVAYHAPLSMRFSKQEYWNGLPFPSPEDLPDPGIKPASSRIVRWV